MSSHQQMLDQNGFRQNQINDFTCSHTKFNQKVSQWDIQNWKFTL